MSLGLGGGGPADVAYTVRFIYDNKAYLRPATASTTQTGLSANSVTDHDRGTIWKATATGTQWVRVDLGAAYPITGLGIANHNLNAIAGAKTLRASTDNFVGSDVSIATLAPTATATDTDYYHSFTSASYRYWEVRIGVGGGDPFPFIGEVFLGTIVAATINQDIGFEDGYTWPQRFAEGEDGALHVNVTGRRVITASMEWGVSQIAAMQVLEQVQLWGQGRGNPYFYIPLQSTGGTAYGRAYMVRNAGPSWSRTAIFTDVYDFGFQFQEDA
jgi:hypothetical protein